MTLSELYRQLLPLLPEHELLWLISHFTGQPRAELLRRLHQASPAPLPDELPAAVSAAVQRRAAGEPLQYITGQQPFWDFDLIVTPDVLIPRWDSETVLEQALRLLPDQTKPYQIADICTGSGAYALVLKAERPAAEVTACDLSPAALAVARQNAAKYRLTVDFRQGDLLAALPPFSQKHYDLIVCNPPYVGTAADLPPDVRQEPALALFGGADGLYFYRRLTAEGVLDYLLPGGDLLLEIGSTQAAAVSELLRQAGFIEIRHGQDLAGLDRWGQGRRPL